MPFLDRIDAGRQLAGQLTHLRGPDLVVLGLPRGGVPVAAQVATALGAPLDVIVVRKLGVPYQPELGMGAVGEGGVRVVNGEVLRISGVGAEELEAVAVRERAEVERRARLFRGDRPAVPLTGKTALVVDDGVATGSTARAACQIARAHGAARVVLAVPVAPPGIRAAIGADADEVVCLETPDVFLAVGQAYADFRQVPDDEVVAWLSGASVPDPPPAAGERDEEVLVTAGDVPLPGHLTVPAGAPGVVLFAHGSGSSRHSPRNRFVADVLNRAGIGTLLFDLLTRDEEGDRANVFDIELLARRLAGATRWLLAEPGMPRLAVGYFGASTGAAADEPRVAAVVSRGGRPDLAAPRLGGVEAPTLLVVGGADAQVLELNELARRQLHCVSRLAVVPGATHLFEEPGALEQAANLARDWFVEHLAVVPDRVT